MVDPARPRGMLRSLRGFLSTGIALIETRLELLTTELKEEKTRIVSLLIYALAALILLSVGTVFLAVLFTALMWESNRLLALGMFATLFLAGGLFAFFMAVRLVRQQSRLFAATLAELKGDRAALDRDE
ncbi:MAG TPA: phage holin family protein [Rhodocyclaceae bacterium]